MSSYSFSEDNFLFNKAELSENYSFDEDDFRISNLSPSTISITTANCKLKLLISYLFSNLAEESLLIRRQKSKISIQMEELENKRKERADYLKEINEEISLNDFEDELNKIRPSKSYQEKFATFDIFFYFTIQKKEFVFQIKSDLFNLNRQYSYELIKNIVKKINEKNITINQNNTNYIVSLKDFDDSEEENNMDLYSRNYELKPINKINFTSIKESENYSSD